VVIEGLALSDWDPRAWRRLVAYVPQTPGMIAGTVAANVRLGWPQATDADVRTRSRSGASA
jgi:ABC-type multidrug transport system fused ATPase/permease subunit